MTELESKMVKRKKQMSEIYKQIYKQNEIEEVNLESRVNIRKVRFEESFDDQS